MRSFLILLLAITAAVAAEPPFEILPGDRVLFLGDTLLEREGTYGYLETRMCEEFADRPFTVRNLSFAGDTPLGISRASFDPPAAGFDRLKEQIELVKPTVVFLGYGMAASLQELTDRSQDPTLNRDTARYGEEPMSAARFKRELGQLMDMIVEKASPAAPGSTRVPRVGSGVPPERTSGDAPTAPRAPGSDNAAEVRDGGTPSPTRETRVLPAVRFVLLSPIRHEDLRATRPGLPDPAEHNKLLTEYSKAIEELAKERGALFVDLAEFDAQKARRQVTNWPSSFTDNGIHLHQRGYEEAGYWIGGKLGWSHPKSEQTSIPALRAAIIAKNELFFHRWRPANSTYLFGFRKNEQGQNAKEIPQFDPLIAAADAEIERLKATARSTPSANQSAPSLNQSAPIPVQSTPGLAQSTPNAAQSSPSVGQSAPSATQSTPNAARSTPGLTQSTPSASQSTPGVTRSAPNGTGSTPNAAGNTPASPPLPTFTVEDGYQIELWAENPLLEKPTEMNWDALGRLWVCSSSLYPMIAPGQVADDKILILSDPEKTGKATKSEVFVKGLLIPTGVVPDLTAEAQRAQSGVEAEKWDAGAALPKNPSADLSKNSAPPRSNAYGCYVGQSTELLHFSPNGEKRIVFSGFGTEDTHHIIHTLRWGPDGRLYFNQSVYIHSHLETPWGMVRLNSGGVFAYDPRTEKLEVFCRGFWNTWGHAWDRWGQSFHSDGAGYTGISWGFPGATFEAYEQQRAKLGSISPGAYPKFAGLELIYSPAFPADWQGNAVTCDFRAHRIVRFSITDLATGGKPQSGYATTAQPDLVRTSDVSFRPIDVKLGPDGALYVADWSNPVINHGEVDFRDPRRDHHSGRIWRISKKGAPMVQWEPLVGKNDQELVEKLPSENLWESAQASTVIFSRELEADIKSHSFMEGIAKKGGVLPDFPEVARPSDRFRRVLDGDERKQIPIQIVIPGAALGATKYMAMRESTEPQDARERCMFVRISAPLTSASWALRDHGSDLEHFRDQAVLDRLKTYTTDPNPPVRLEAMRALARIPTARSAELVLDAALKAPEGDAFYQHAAWLSINDLAQPWLDALASGAWKAEGRERQLEFALAALPPAAARGALAKVLGAGPIDFAKGPWAEIIGRAGDAAQLRQLFDALLVSFGTDCCPGEEIKDLHAIPIDDGAALRCVDALLEAARVRGLRPTGDLNTLQRLVFHTNADVRAGVLRLVGYWRPASGIDWLREVFDENALDPAPAAAAIESLRALGGAPAIELLKKLAGPKTPAPSRQRAAVALAALDMNGSLPLVAAALSAGPDQAAALAGWRDLFKIKGALEAVTAQFATAPWAKTLSKPAITAGLRAAHEAGKAGEPLVAALTPLAGLTETAGTAPVDYAAVIAQVKRAGDAARGELVYRRATSGCTTCHSIGGAGGIVGPSLTSLGASAPLDYIIESVFLPNAKVKEGYNAVTLTLQDGTQASGIQVRETADQIFLRNVAGQETAVVKANITGKTDIGSIMPAGLIDQYPESDRLDLFAFLGELGKPGPFDASKANTARVWKLYPATSKDAALKAAPSDATANALTLVDGRLLKAHLSEALQLVTKPGDRIWAVTQFQTATAGAAKVSLDGADRALLDGKPMATALEGRLRNDLGAPLQADIPAGIHTLAVELDVKALPEILRATSPEASFTTD